MRTFQDGYDDYTATFTNIPIDEYEYEVDEYEDKPQSREKSLTIITGMLRLVAARKAKEELYAELHGSW